MGVVSEPNYCLTITEANHADNQFYTLGGAGCATRTEQQANLATIPEYSHDCVQDDRCYILDVTDADGWTIVDGREISAETARVLLGVDDLGPLREQARVELAAVIAASAAAAGS